MKLYFSKWIIPFCVFLAFLLFYSYTMFDGIGGRINYGDSAKWQYLHYVNGLPHGPGYPQFLILTELFSRIVFFLPDVERITFISVFFGATALGLFYMLLHNLTGNRLGSVIATTFFGITYVFWTQATEAEVYTLNICYLLLVFYLFIKYHQTERSVFFMTGCAVYALSFGNHLSMITILPALLFITFTSNFRKVLTWKNIGIIALFILIGVSQYALIFYRACQIENPFYREIVKDPSFEELMSYITGPKDIMFQFSFTDIFFGRMKLLSAYMIDELSIIGIILSFAGFFYWIYTTKEWKIIGFLVLALIGQIIFHISYDVGDLIVFFLPVYMIMALFAGLIFKSTKTYILSLVFAITIILLFNYNINSRKILKSDSFELVQFSATRELFMGKDLPLFFPTDYSNACYTNYVNIKRLWGDQPIHRVWHQVNELDSFYVFDHQVHHVDLNDFDLYPVESINILSFVKKMRVEGKVIFIGASDEASGSLNEDFKEYIRQAGGKINDLGFRSSYTSVITNNVVYDQVNNEEKRHRFSGIDSLQRKYHYILESAGWESGNFCSFKINDFEYSTVNRGLTVVVWNLDKNKAESIVTFDTHSGQMLTLFKAVKRNVNEN